MNIVRTFAILRFKFCHQQFKIKIIGKTEFKIKTLKQYGRTQRLNILKFHKIATFVRKKVYINTEKNQKKSVR